MGGQITTTEKTVITAKINHFQSDFLSIVGPLLSIRVPRIPFFFRRVSTSVNLL
jgi:hypothetical protein